jgi:methylamine dehydrogenase accessory protein MauD
MSGWWVVSYLVLWSVVILTLVVLLIVLRQLGLIYLRSGTALQLDEGPELGAPFPMFEELDQRTGLPVRFPDRDAGISLLLFTTPQCGLCKEVLDATAVVSRHRELDTMVLSAGEADENDELLNLAGEMSFVVSLRRQRELGVQTIPYGIVVGRDGVVLSKGTLNSLDDLEDALDRADAQESARSPTVMTSGRVNDEHGSYSHH